MVSAATFIASGGTHCVLCFNAEELVRNDSFFDFIAERAVMVAQRQIVLYGTLCLLFLVSVSFLVLQSEWLRETRTYPACVPPADRLDHNRTRHDAQEPAAVAPDANVGDAIFALIEEYERDPEFLDGGERSLKEQYTEASTDTAFCQRYFSKELITQWENAHLNLCYDETSRIDCHLMVHHPTTSVLNLCSARNAMIDTGVGDWGSKLDHNFRGGNEAIASGAFQVSCPTWRVDYFSNLQQTLYPTCLGAWMRDALIGNQKGLCSSKASAVQQPPHRNRTSVAFLTRWREHNIFHIMDDMTQTFVSLAILRNELLRRPDSSVVNWTGVQFVFVDDMVEGKLWELWPKLFSGPSAEGILRVQDNPLSEGECVEHAIFNVHGGISPLSYVGRNVWCRSSVLAAFAEWLRRHSGVETEETARRRLISRIHSSSSVEREQSGLEPFQVTWIARRPYPGRESRSLQNRDAIKSKLTDALESLNKEMVWQNSSFSHVHLSVVFLEDMELSDIIRLMDTTNVLMGVHGAGLANAFWMRRDAVRPYVNVLFELHVPGSSANRHYFNIAHWIGLRYETAPLSSINPQYEEIWRPLQGIVSRAVNVTYN